MKILRVLTGSASLFIIASASLSSLTLAQAPPGQTAPPAAPGQGAGQGSKEVPAPNAPQTSPQQAAATLTDVEFVAKAAAGNRYEVEAARLAVAKASSAKAKDFAGVLVSEHGDILKDLDKAAKEAGVAVPADFAPDAFQKASLEALKGKSGTEFDELFLADMTKAHYTSLELLTRYMQTGKNTKLQAWASKTLPTVQKHRDMLKQM